MISCANWWYVGCNCGICCIIRTSPQSGSHRDAMREFGARFCTALPAESDGYTGIAFGLTCAVVFTALFKLTFSGTFNAHALTLYNNIETFGRNVAFDGRSSAETEQHNVKTITHSESIDKGSVSSQEFSPPFLKKGAISPLPLRVMAGKFVDPLSQSPSIKVYYRLRPTLCSKHRLKALFSLTPPIIFTG